MAEVAAHEPGSCPDVNECRANIGNIAKIVDRHEQAITALQNRLPVWATLAISLLTFLLGWSWKG